MKSFVRRRDEDQSAFTHYPRQGEKRAWDGKNFRLFNGLDFAGESAI